MARQWRPQRGFIVTALLGIVGALVATFLGQALGIYAAPRARPPRRGIAGLQNERGSFSTCSAI
jgi:hypothetical protein